MANQVPAVVPAIYGATKNSRIRTSMVFGSDLESGWSGSASNPSGATGWYQILLPVHPGVTAQEAEDPVWSTNYMLPAYTSAAAQVSDKTWRTNPELAAEQTVITAEQPGGPFPTDQVGPYGGEGTAVVDQDWQNTANLLVGQWRPGNNISLPAQTTSDLTGGGNALAPSNWWEAVLGGPQSIIQYAAQKAGNGASGASEATGIEKILNFIYGLLTNPVDLMERGALILFGGIIIIVGLVILASGTRAGRTVGSAATRGVSTRVSGGISGATEDRARRLALSEEANRIGERKVALKEKREERLSRTASVNRPAQGRHAKGGRNASIPKVEAA